jgi:hypothetical protein
MTLDPNTQKSAPRQGPKRSMEQAEARLLQGIQKRDLGRVVARPSSGWSGGGSTSWHTEKMPSFSS